ncbi:MAG: nucleoside deaminase [Bacteriovoracaceae bacterium]|nr:nucleoside deaminase [Bacteriovoracaceae bacterium]
MKFEDHLWSMGLALEMAEQAYRENEVPVGAVIVDAFGKVISKGRNNKESENDPCGHAEIIAIREAAKKTGEWRLLDSTLYVTLEPCPMCLSAALQARVKTVVFGAYDKKGGALSLGYLFNNDARLNHKLKVIGGVRHFDCGQLISNFFRDKRSGYKHKNKFVKES